VFVVQGTEKREDDAGKVDHTMARFSALAIFDVV